MKTPSLILPERHFDIVFMDLGLPGIDGLGATRQIRAMNITTPVVALTANAYDEDRRRLSSGRYERLFDQADRDQCPAPDADHLDT